jgi:hypothetical protein
MQAYVCLSAFHAALKSVRVDEKKVKIDISIDF